MDNERLIDEVKQNIEKNKSSNKKILMIIATILLVVILGVIFLNYNKNCSGSSCTLTGNAVSIDSSPIVAEYDGGKINAYELDQDYYLYFFLRGLPKSYSVLLPKEDVLNQTISKEVLYLDVSKKGYEISDEEYKKGLELSLKNSGTDIEQFKKALDDENLSYDFFESFYKKQLAIGNFLETVLFKDVKTSEDEIKNYYNDNLDSFKVPEQVKASHILVNDSETAKELIKKLDDGENFSELAKENSVGPSASVGGDLGFFEKGKMVPEFDEAVFNLKKIGDYTKTPVKTQYGYHVILLTDKKPASTLGFEEAKKDIEDKILINKKNDILKKYLDDLLANANIKIYPENIISENESGNTKTQ